MKEIKKHENNNYLALTCHLGSFDPKVHSSWVGVYKATNETDDPKIIPDANYSTFFYLPSKKYHTSHQKNQQVFPPGKYDLRLFKTKAVIDPVHSFDFKIDTEKNVEVK